MEKGIKILLVLFFVVGFFGVQVGGVLAQSTVTIPGGGTTSTPGYNRTSTPRDDEVVVVPLNNPINETSIPVIIGKIIRVIIGLVGTLALVMFIYAGFVWLTAQGNMEKIKKGRDTMVWAIIGLIVVFSSYAVLTYVFNLLKF